MPGIIMQILLKSEYDDTPLTILHIQLNFYTTINKFLQTRLQNKLDAITRAMKNSVKAHTKITVPSSAALRIFLDFPDVISLSSFFIVFR